MGVIIFPEAGLCLIEWPSRGEGALPAADLTVRLDYNLPGRNAMIIAAHGKGAGDVDEAAGGSMSIIRDNMERFAQAPWQNNNAKS